MLWPHLQDSLGRTHGHRFGPTIALLTERRSAAPDVHRSDLTGVSFVAWRRDGLSSRRRGLTRPE